MLDKKNRIYKIMIKSDVLGISKVYMIIYGSRYCSGSNIYSCITNKSILLHRFGKICDVLYVKVLFPLFF